jgi:hypothetical protein
MQANRQRKFKAPRLLKGKDTTRDSDSDGDNIPFSELREKVRAETLGIDCEEDSNPLSQGQTKDATPLKCKSTGILLLNEREADETARFGEVLRWSDDDDRVEVPMSTLLDSPQESALPIAEPYQESALPVTSTLKRRNARLPKPNMVGIKVSRDFGKAGIFHGEVKAVEYDSADEEKVEPIYVVEYTDGDREDFDAEQLRYGRELFHTVVLANDEGSNVTSGSDEEESYRPPKVGLTFNKTITHSCYHFLNFCRKKKGFTLQ